MPMSSTTMSGFQSVTRRSNALVWSSVATSSESAVPARSMVATSCGSSSTIRMRPVFLLMMSRLQIRGCRYPSRKMVKNLLRTDWSGRLDRAAREFFKGGLQADRRGPADGLDPLATHGGVDREVQRAQRRQVEVGVGDEAAQLEIQLVLADRAEDDAGGGVLHHMLGLARAADENALDLPRVGAGRHAQLHDHAGDAVLVGPVGDGACDQGGVRHDDRSAIESLDLGRAHRDALDDAFGAADHDPVAGLDRPL